VGLQKALSVPNSQSYGAIRRNTPLTGLDTAWYPNPPAGACSPPTSLCSELPSGAHSLMKATTADGGPKPAAVSALVLGQLVAQRHLLPVALGLGSD
jgi:hypothetical protein